MIPLAHVLVLAAALFAVGLVGFLIRKDVLVMMTSLQLMLGSVLLALGGFAAPGVAAPGDARGRSIALLMMVIVAGQTALGIAMLLLLYRRRGELNPTSWERLKDW